MTTNIAAIGATVPQTPPLPEARPEKLGLSTSRLQRMSDAFKREIDKGTAPGVTVMVARHGQIGWFEALGQQTPGSSTPMARDSIFRIFSMTKPIVSIGIMQLVEDGLILLTDPVEKFLPEFAKLRVGIENCGQLEYTLPRRPPTIQDLLRHTSGIAYEISGDGMIHRLYQKSDLRKRSITNAEHASLVASLPLIAQPGAEWHYSRSTDILGRIIEVVSGQSLGDYLQAHVLAPTGMLETGFSTDAANSARIAHPFANDPWTGDKVVLFNPLDKPVMESGGGGLVSTTMDYARFCQMLLNGGHIDGNRIIGRKTLELMTANHLSPDVKIATPILQSGHGFGLGFAVRTSIGEASVPGSVGQFFWSGVAGTFFWVDPKEEMFAVFMSQGPGQREYFRTLVRSLVYASLD